MIIYEKLRMEIARIFQQHGVFDFITKCYDILHLSSYQCALSDVEEMLRNRGVSIC